MSGGGKGGEGNGQTDPQTGFPPRSRKQSFLFVTLGTHLRKKKPGFLKLFYKRWEQSNRCFDIHRFLKRIFFHPGQFFFSRRGIISRGGTGNRNFLATSHPPTYLPTYPPLPLPPLFLPDGEERGGGGELLLRGLAGGVHQCGPGRRTPSLYFSTRTAEDRCRRPQQKYVTLMRVLKNIKDTEENGRACHRRWDVCGPE